MVNREGYVQNRKYQVVRDGAEVTGYISTAPFVRKPFRLSLPVGAILTCDGCGWTYGDGAFVVKWLDKDGEQICQDAEFRPYIGHWMMPEPDPDYLQPLEDKSEQGVA